MRFRRATRWISGFRFWPASSAALLSAALIGSAIARVLIAVQGLAVRLRRSAGLKLSRTGHSS